MAPPTWQGSKLQRAALTHPGMSSPGQQSASRSASVPFPSKGHVLWGTGTWQSPFHCWAVPQIQLRPTSPVGTSFLSRSRESKSSGRAFYLTAPFCQILLLINSETPVLPLFLLWLGIAQTGAAGSTSLNTCSLELNSGLAGEAT